MESKKQTVIKVYSSINIQHNTVVQNEKKSSNNYKEEKKKNIDTKHPTSSVHYTPFSCYLALPKPISDTHAVVNIKNNDHASFYWSILAQMVPQKNHPECVFNYPHYGQILNTSGMEFPMKMSDIPIFEKNNNISINVFGLDKKYQIIGPYHHTRERKLNHFNLLYLIGENGRGHFCWIKNLSKLILKQFSKTKKQKKYLCDGCLTPFGNINARNLHQVKTCKKVKYVVPDERSTINFKKLENQTRVKY